MNQHRLPYRLEILRWVPYCLLSCANVSALWAAPPPAETALRCDAVSIRLDGDSTTRKYSAVGNPVVLTGQATPQSKLLPNLSWAPARLTMRLAVDDLKSGERVLDKHLRENLKAEQFREITMELGAFKPAPGEAGKILASGHLTVAGVSQPIELSTQVLVEGRRAKIHGVQNLKMSDFGIVPPTLMMGTLKTRDAVTITYDATCSDESESESKK